MSFNTKLDSLFEELKDKLFEEYGITLKYDGAKQAIIEAVKELIGEDERDELQQARADVLSQSP